MSDEQKFYKYVILRDRDGNYLLPYSGVQGLADVAFTGSYNDLLDLPPDGSYLPATKSVDSDNFYNVAYSVSFNESAVLDKTPDYFDEDIVNLDTELNEDYEEQTGDFIYDSLVVDEKYVYNVSHKLADLLQNQLNRAYIEATKEPDPDETWTPKYCGSVDTLVQLNAIQGSNLYDVYYVTERMKWYMYIENDAHVREWVSEYKGKEVTPS